MNQGVLRASRKLLLRGNSAASAHRPPDAPLLSGLRWDTLPCMVEMSDARTTPEIGKAFRLFGGGMSRKLISVAAMERWARQMWGRPKRRESAEARAAEATAILQELRNVPAQYATAKTVAAYERALALLEVDVGSADWFETVTQLGSHLMESPDGARGENVKRARGLYGWAGHVAHDQEGAGAWSVLAASGYANSLATDPASEAEDMVEALDLFDWLIETYRAVGNLELLATTLGQASKAHWRFQGDDRVAHLDAAILLQEEAVHLLEGAGPELASLRGRALHNLGVFYSEHPSGLRSVNVDRAVRRFQAALQDRPSESDPIGRARTLRALGLLYPEWGGADSLDHARDLAAAARSEAESLEWFSDAARARTTGWAYLERTKSALNVNLDALYRQDRVEARNHLRAAITEHAKAVSVISRESMPYQWAEWQAGLGRLYGRGPSLGDWTELKDAYRCFKLALGAFEPAERPYLGRQIYERWGELCHEIGDFEQSLICYRRALDLSDLALTAATDPAHRLLEIRESRGFGLFAAYAAARLGLAEDALALAERERVRLQAQLLQARVALSQTGRVRSQVEDALERVRQLERDLTALEERDPDTEIERQASTIADLLGVDISAVNIRRVDAERDASNPVAAEREMLRSTLQEARALLDTLVAPTAASWTAGAAGIVEVAQMIAAPIVYLVATVHGAAALAAFPSGEAQILLLDELTSDITGQMLHGTTDAVGFVEAISEERPDVLPEALSSIDAVLRAGLFAHLTPWLEKHSATGAVLVPLGRLGSLPLHVASDFAYTYAPSAGALRSPTSDATQPGLLVLADPDRHDVEALPFAVIEARVLAAGSGSALVLSGTEATKDALTEFSPAYGHVHFGCHGTFSPSRPLASELLLAGNDRVTVADVFSRTIDLSTAHLVTLLACDSGRAEYRSTPDECMSFPGALVIGGVRSVVSTMWPVNDAAAAFFSIKLNELIYRQNVRLGDAVARTRKWLRTASGNELIDVVNAIRAHLTTEDEHLVDQLDDLAAFLADSTHVPPFSNPDLWGPFILTGRP